MKNFLNVRSLTVLGLLLLNLSFDYPQKNGKIEFFAIGKPSLLKVHGTSHANQGTLKLEKEKLSGQFTVKLDTFDTGLGTRDRHMKEKYLEVEKYPEAKFTLEELTLQGGKASGPFKGKLSLHGVENPVSGHATVASSEKEVSYTAKFEIKLSDYKIDSPKFAGVSIQDVVTIEAQGTSI